MTRLDVATGRDTARARRWLMRALFVVGGAMAGTAAAWAIGTAGASADPAVRDASCLPHLTGAASGLVQAVSKDHHPEGGCDRRMVTDEVRDAAGTVADGELARPARNVAGSLDLVADPPRQAPRVIGETLRPTPGLLGFLQPASGDLLRIPALPLVEPQAGTGAVPMSAQIPLAVPDGQADPAKGAPAVADSRANVGDHSVARANGHTLEHPLPGSFPLSPSPVAPSPPALPLPGGSAATAHADGPVFGVPAPASALTAADGSRCLRFGTRHLPVEPGTQPGVTPD